MKKWDKKHFSIAALSLLLFTNAFVLAGITYNRSGEPLTQIKLTERELNLPYRYRIKKEDSGVELILQWRVIPGKDNYGEYGYYSSRYADAKWLDEAKLKKLGFDTSHPLHSKTAYRVYGNIPAKEAFVVLEYNGVSYQHALEKAEQYLRDKQALLEKVTGENKKREERKMERALKSFDEEKTSRSRLFVIDAGLDATQLRKQYADKQRYLVLKGKVDISLHGNKKEKYLRGRVSEIFNDTVHVPLPFREHLASYTNDKTYRQREAELPRFQAELAWGKRYEPWIVSVSENE